MALKFCDHHGKDSYVAYDPTRFPGGCPQCHPVVVAEVSPRAAEAGGGWNGSVLVNGEVVAGGAFPVCEEMPDSDTAWSVAFEWAEETAANYGGREYTS